MEYTEKRSILSAMHEWNNVWTRGAGMNPGWLFLDTKEGSLLCLLLWTTMILKIEHGGLVADVLREYIDTFSKKIYEGFSLNRWNIQNQWVSCYNINRILSFSKVLIKRKKRIFMVDMGTFFAPFLKFFTNAWNVGGIGFRSTVIRDFIEAQIAFNK